HSHQQSSHRSGAVRVGHDWPGAVQHGKGADMGAAFGSGSSGSLFGASGGANFLSRSTAVLAAVFFVSTLGLAYTGNQRPAESGTGGSVLERAATPDASIPTPGSTPAPAADVPAASSGGAAQIPTK
ncbi:MAG: preprotein translocase, SecG subunit, partial [Pseudomonadota bacterium]